MGKPEIQRHVYTSHNGIYTIMNMYTVYIYIEYNVHVCTRTLHVQVSAAVYVHVSSPPPPSGGAAGMASPAAFVVTGTTLEMGCSS